MRTPSLVLLACLAAVGAVATGADAAPAAAAPGRYIVIAPNKAAFNSALSDARAGTSVALTMAPVNAFVVNASPAVARALGRLSGAAVVPDRIESIDQPGSDVGTGWADPADVSAATPAGRLAARRRTASPFAMPAATPFGILSGFTRTRRSGWARRVRCGTSSASAHLRPGRRTAVTTASSSPWRTPGSTTRTTS